ncbi:MAG TPA: hypothetical protein VFE47_02025 [Tepidisphaeraceae bacterium]|jgi:hypothetical protein|nr:hypothetical protein [Tepidisphaeraceae bacterium]
MSAVPPIPLTYLRPIDHVSISAWRPLAKVVAIIALISGSLVTARSVANVNAIRQIYPLSQCFQAPAPARRGFGPAVTRASIREIWARSILSLICNFIFAIGGLMMLFNLRIGRIFILIGIAWLGYNALMYINSAWNSPATSTPIIYRKQIQQMRLETLVWAVSLLTFAVFACLVLLVPRNLFGARRARR